VTTQAPLGKLGHAVLRDMNVVAGEARHIRRAEATALLQHPHLVSMNVRRSSGVGRRKIDVLIEGLAGTVGKRPLKRSARSGMTPGTQIHLAIPRESCRIQYAGGRRSRRLRCLMFNVFPSRPVTGFALDAEREARSVIAVGQR
jgi:hypothetical protein